MQQLSCDQTACPDLNHFELVAKIMADELASLELDAEPLDVAETIETLSEEMGGMPQIITDCRLAMEAFSELDGVLDRMFSLADRAAECPEDQESLFERLDDEFSGYAHIVARLAGADDFDGPSLSVGSREEAQVARRILGCLGTARHSFSRRLEAQRRRINGAMGESLEMISRILTEVEDISYATRESLTELLAHLKTLGREFDEGLNKTPKLWLN
jgi:hypothetical protein